MRVVFVGAAEVSLATANALIKKGHEVVIIERDKAKIDELSDRMDCSFLHGDGSRPDVLKEVNPAKTDVLFCLTNSDQANVIASLVGRSLEFKRVVTSISDTQFEEVCLELGLKDTIVPNRTISRSLVDLAEGEQSAELSPAIKDEARLFVFEAAEEEAKLVGEIELPSDARIICFYRDDQFTLATTDSKLAAGDEVVILTHSKNLPQLQERWQHAPEQS